MSRRIVIVGGVAGGATAAARARRMDEHAEIVMFERGPHVSFASCGLPYHVGEVIPKESTLVLMTPARFKERLNVDVRVSTEVVSIDRERREVTWRKVETGETGTMSYDALLLSTGAKPVRPPVPGFDQPGVFTLRTIPDTRDLKAWMDTRKATRAVVVGGGFIGLEMAENLVHKGLKVTVVEAGSQVMAPLDPEMASLVSDHLRAKGVDLRLNDSVIAIDPDMTVRTKAGEVIPTDVVVLGIGVRPENDLAKAIGLKLGATGGVVVDEQMRTEDPHIWAVGDLIEGPCAVTERPMLLPLAGPANRQGRVAADAMCGRPTKYRGLLGTAVAGVLGMTVATTGVAWKRLPAEVQARAHAVWLHPKDHVAWYPGAESIHLKLIFDTDGKILGAQAVGMAGAERRIDVIATTMQLGGTVFDLEEAELAYAPQYGAAKDAVNIAGMVAGNTLRGDLVNAKWEQIGKSDAFLVDVREAGEFKAGHVPGATNLPLSTLRDWAGTLPTDREVWLYCQSGKRSYDSARALMQRGVNVKNLPGGYETWLQFHSAGLL